MKVFLLAGFALPLLFVLDFVWVSVFMHGFYRDQLGGLLAVDTLWPVALAFYMVYALALGYFAVRPALERRSLKVALLLGAFLGLATYIVYDFTNWATLRDWPWLVAVVDLAWGVVLSAFAAGGSYLMAAKFTKL
ncbi:MAG TPA: DUF2177 family protein [Candidatus Paceibacterota bacterium]|nr:DUF2177 family protein [Candidatus Paceibacterota bacterium]